MKGEMVRKHVLRQNPLDTIRNESLASWITCSAPSFFYASTGILPLLNKTLEAIATSLSRQYSLALMC